MDTIEFDYRLPLTYVRVTGTKSVTTVAGTTTTTECKAVVTTELAADRRTRCHVTINPESGGSQKSTWTLTSDGRLSGADASLTTEPLARWTAGLRLGSLVAGIRARGIDEPPATFDAPADADPAHWDVRAEYATEHPDEARALANLRSGLARATNAHAQAVRAAASGQTPDELRYWGDRAAQLRLVLTAAVFGAARAEHVYSTWLASKTELTVTQHDVRLEIDRVPTHAQVTHWAAGSSGSLPSDWVATVETLQTAICIDLEGPGDLSVGTGLRFEPQASDDVVHFRPPRAAVLRVFKAVPSSTQPGRHTLDPVEVRHLAVACPGNETRISVQTSSRATSAVRGHVRRLRRAHEGHHRPEGPGRAALHRGEEPRGRGHRVRHLGQGPS